MLLSNHQSPGKARVTKVQRVRRHQSLKIHPHRTIDFTADSIHHSQSNEDKILSAETVDHHSNKLNKRSAATTRTIHVSQSNTMFRYQIHADELHSNLHTNQNAKKDNFPPHYGIVSLETERINATVTRTNRDCDRGQVLNEKKKRKRRKIFGNHSCLCSPCCFLASVLSGFLLVGLASAILVALIITNRSSTTTSVTTLTTSTVTWVSTTTTSTSSTSTTTARICLFSCLNKTWISSAGLLAKWTFDGTFLDQANTYNTTAVNNPSFVNNGYVKQGIILDATSNQFLYTSYIPLINASFTIEVWLYPTGFPNPKDHSILGLCTNPFGDQCLHLTIRNFTGIYSLYMAFFGDNCPSNLPVSLNQWIHAAFTFDLTTRSMSIYQDGILGGNCISALPLQGVPNNVTIGYIPRIVAIHGTNFFQGYLDQLTIFNRVKSRCEIFDDATLATYYSFDTNPTVIDEGPNSLSSIAQNVSYTSSGHRSAAISFNFNTSSFEILGLTGLGVVNKPFSISLWLRPDSLVGTLVFVENGTAGFHWCIPFLGFAANDSLVAQVWTGIAQAVFGPVLSTSSVWYHIVQTWSSTNGLRLYVDNTLVGVNSLATSYSASSLPNNVRIANRPANACGQGAVPPPFAYRGNIDDFRIYSRELTADDICALYNY